MRNVLIISHSLRNGGAERIAGLLSRELSKFYNVYLALNLPGNIVYEYYGQIIDVGQNVEESEVLIEEYKKKLDIYCSISFCEPFNFINIRTCVGEKVIVSVRSNLSIENAKKPWNKKMIEQYFGYSDAIVSISDGVRDDLINTYRVNPRLITTIYNFFDKEAIIKKSRALICDESIKDFIDGKRVIVNIGRLETQKNQELLIKAFSKINDSKNEFVLLIIGSGRLEEHLKSVAEECKLTAKIMFTPYMSNPFPLLKKAFAFVLSSDYEGWGNVLMEAMALGVPVISRDCLSGPREIIAGNNYYSECIEDFIPYKRGILVSRSKGEKHLANAINYMIENETYRKQTVANAKHFIESYSNESIINQWKNIIEKIDHRFVPPMIHNCPTEVAIYGAGERAQKVYSSLKLMGYDVVFFVVTTMENNPKKINNIPVIDLDSIKDVKRYWIAIGVDKHKDEVIDSLEKRRIKNYFFPRMVPLVFKNNRCKLENIK